MSITKNLGLNKHDNVQTNTDAFDIEKYLNDNWDIIDNSTGEITKNIGENLEKINTNEKNIETISTNVTGTITDISNLKEENERLRKDLQSSQIVGQANGERIDLDNSSDARFLKFGIGGNHSQETRDGYNLYNYKNVEKNKKIDGDTGNLTDDGNFCFSGYIEVKENTNYIRSDVGTSTNVMLDENKNRIGKTSGVSFTTPNNCKYVAFSISRAKYDDNSYLKFVMNEGTELKAFEEYGKSPSPDYPSEIKKNENNIQIKVINKNILKFENKTGAGVTYNGNRITVKNPTNYFYATTNVQGDKTFSGKSYKLKYIVNGTISSTDGNIRFYWGKTGNNYYAALSLSSGTFNNKEYNNTLYLGTDEIINNFRMEKPSDNCICDITIDVMLYESNDDDTYTEHQEQTFILPVQQDMLTGDYISDVEHHEWGKLIFDENSDMECIHNNKTFQFRFLKHLEGTDATTKVICNMAKYWNTGAWEENGCFVSYNGYFYIICKENEFGFNADMTIDEAIAHFKTILANSKLIAYYKLKTPIELDFTDEQKVVAKQIKETLHTYKNVTHIYSSNETNPIFNIEYAIDPNIQNSKIQEQLQQLISATQIKETKEEG